MRLTLVVARLGTVVPPPVSPRASTKAATARTAASGTGTRIMTEKDDGFMASPESPDDLVPGHSEWTAAARSQLRGARTDAGN
jgi:hypothetical protein